MNTEKITVAIIGCGGRGKDTYAKAQEKLCNQMQIVAAVDINPKRLLEMEMEYGVPRENCFCSVDDFFAQPKMADIAFICTMDKEHYAHAIQAMKSGYHLLLEKPISPYLNECKEIEAVAKKYNRHVVVCHVLRYTAFYKKIKECLQAGVIGDIVSIQAIEGVAYWHQAHSFVRGNWRNQEEACPMILAKCCHDFDILLWLCGKKCKRVSSFGNLRLFKKSNAPEGATQRCTDGCPYVDSCAYSAPRYYLGQLRDGKTDWPVNILNSHPTEENIMEALKTGPYGRCVYHCDNDVVDHQVVNMQLEDGTTINFTMCAFTKNGFRKLRIMGTLGEIEGDMETNRIYLKPFAGETTEIDVYTLSDDFSGHGGGDVQMLREVIALIQKGEIAGSSITTIEQSMQSHYVAFAAEASRVNNGRVVDMVSFLNGNRSI